MWDLPGPGVEPVSPALSGGFLTTAPPGKSDTLAFELVNLLLMMGYLMKEGHLGEVQVVEIKGSIF